MLSFERNQQILDFLKKNKSATVEILCKGVYASAATIRRDLAQLEKDGLLQRVRGGAVIIEASNQDTPLLFRTNYNMDKKKYISSLALKYIKNSSILIMDSSTTATVLASQLDVYNNITVITNGIEVINVLNEKTDAKIISCGGLLEKHSSFVGKHVIDMLNDYYADVMFISCCGVNENFVVTEADEQYAQIKKQMLKSAKKKILLCDSSKFGKTYFAKVCDLKDFDVVITDKKPPEEFDKHLQNIIY